MICAQETERRDQRPGAHACHEVELRALKRCILHLGPSLQHTDPEGPELPSAGEHQDFIGERLVRAAQSLLFRMPVLQSPEQPLGNVIPLRK
jgi:hypothetical protein